jgi:hypothetical protein
MFIVAPSDPIYHLARSDGADETLTLCMRSIITEPNKRRRFADWRLEPEIPTNRVCILCTECAERSGDTRSFSERITYPVIASQVLR